MTQYVQLSADHVITVYASPQNATDKPGYTVMDDDDPRFQAWTVQQLATSLKNAAAKATNAITSQIVPDQTHQLAYANAATIVGPGATVPTTEPTKSAFAAMAAANGYTDPQAFATLVVAIGAASLTLSTLLATLNNAADAAPNGATLATALTAFETALATFVATINGAGLSTTIVAPTPISLPGINA